MAVTIEVDDWLAERMAALRAQAEERRAVLRLQCGRALRAIRDRGQNMAGLAVMARMTPKTVRELVKAAENESAALDVGDDPEPGQEHQVTETSVDRNGSEEPWVRPGDPENTTPLAQTDSAEARADTNGEAAVTTDQLVKHLELPRTVNREPSQGAPLDGRRVAQHIESAQAVDGPGGPPWSPRLRTTRRPRPLCGRRIDPLSDQIMARSEPTGSMPSELSADA